MKPNPFLHSIYDVLLYVESFFQCTYSILKKHPTLFKNPVYQNIIDTVNIKLHFSAKNMILGNKTVSAYLLFFKI